MSKKRTARPKLDEGFPNKSAVCGKYVFDTRQRAKRYASSHALPNKKLRPYLCLTCDKWHVTSWDAERTAHYRDDQLARRAHNEK